MTQRKTLLNFIKAVSLSLVFAAPIASAATQKIEANTWYMVSLPGDAKKAGTIRSLIGDALSSKALTYTYNSRKRRYVKLSKDEPLVASEAFFFQQRTGRAINVDLSNLVKPVALKTSSACSSSAGCVEHIIDANGVSSRTLVGVPFAEGVAVDAIRLVTEYGACSDGCSITESRSERLSRGRFDNYDYAKRKNYSFKGNDVLEPGVGYWFYTYIPADAGETKLLIPAAGSANEPDQEPDNNGATLLFKSGFEGSVSVVDSDDGYLRIKGNDEGFSWNTLLPDNEDKRVTTGVWKSYNNGIHPINVDYTANELDSVAGPDASVSNNTALFQKVIEPGIKREYTYSNGKKKNIRTQTPFQINKIQNDPDEYYIKYWMKLDTTKLKTKDDWRIIWQYKSDHWNDSETTFGYRISAYIYADTETGMEYWNVKGDDLARRNAQPPLDKNYWSQAYKATNSESPVVKRGEWFKVEVYSKVSANDDGRFWIKIDGDKIAENNGPNLGSESDSLNFMMLWQLYVDSAQDDAHQWIDDIEIWDKVPY